MIPVAPNDIVVFVGDSITDQGCFSPAIDMMNLSLTPRQSGAARCVGPRVGVTVARGGRAIARTVPQQPIRPIISGTPGDTAAAIAAAVPARITNFNPNVVVLFVGVNDALSATPLANFRASVAAIFAGVAAYGVATPMLALSIFEINEQWAIGPVWNNASDATVLAYDGETQAAVAAAALTRLEYCDLRAGALAYEAAHNTPAPGLAVGVLTLDGIHPTPAGQINISQSTVASMAIS